MSSTVTAIIPVNRDELSINSLGTLFKLIEKRLNSISKAFHATDDFRTNCSSIIKSDISPCLGSARFFLKTHSHTRTVHVHTKCHSDHNDLHQGYKICISTGEFDFGHELIRVVSRGLGGIITSDSLRNTEKTNKPYSEVIAEQHENVSYRTASEENTTIRLSLADFIFQERLVKKLNINKQIECSDYISHHFNPHSGALSYFNDNNQTILEIDGSVFIPPKNISITRNFKIERPLWASLVLTNKYNNSQVFGTEIDGRYVGGYEIAPDNFTHTFDKKQWHSQNIFTP